jgi:hypothetical protein
VLNIVSAYAHLQIAAIDVGSKQFVILYFIILCQIFTIM